jgi:hypothetical protein
MEADMGDVTVRSLQNRVPEDLNWFDARYNDRGAEVLTQGRAIVSATVDGKPVVEVPLNDGTYTDQKYFKDPAQVKFDKRAFDAFLNDARHREPVQRLQRNGVTLPLALGHQPIKQPQGD